MRKAILEKFIFVLLAALCINSVIFYIASRNTILDTTRKDMLYTMEMIDRTLDYDGDLLEQVRRMETFTAGNTSRITLIRTDGTVVSDSDADPLELDNHLSRKEMWSRHWKMAAALPDVIPIPQREIFYMWPIDPTGQI